ncbi:unnamed protein product [Taenia asiatica]|uniref:Uncharacterized protein n=1 Tax=Taenia asiatica TaxID=60517 RepID=A0A0R3WDA9_TAEAS|nr:unnamed protein product [Taenia asiatica]
MVSQGRRQTGADDAFEQILLMDLRDIHANYLTGTDLHLHHEDEEEEEEEERGTKCTLVVVVVVVVVVVAADETACTANG